MSVNAWGSVETQLAQPTGASPPASTDEMTLLRLARAGDLQAFRQLVLQHQARVYGIALRLTSQPASAVELAQEVFVRLHAALARIASPAHLMHWLSRTVSPQAPDAEHDPLTVATDPGPEFTERVLARVELRWSHRARTKFTSSGSASQHHWRRRFILFGIALIAGLATMLWLSRGPQQPVATAVSAPDPAAASSTPVRVETSPTPPGSTASTTTASASARPSVQQDAYQRYILIAMPLQHDSQDPAARAAADAFYTALLDELRKVPRLTLLIPGVTAPPTDNDMPADYLLTITGIETTMLPSGSMAFRVTDGRGASAASLPTSLLSAGSNLPSQKWPVEIRIQPIGQPASGGFSSTLQVGAAGAVQLAVQQAQMLQTRLFPDAVVRQQLLARIRDGSLTGMERSRALSDLLGAQSRGGGPGLDFADVNAIVGLAAVMNANQRAQLWRSLRSVSHPDLVEPLLDSIRRDTDVEVRFEALSTLVANHGTEPQVRNAMEWIARDDSQQVMRMAARRVLHGDAEWRAYLLRTLKDTGLPYAERLAPLLLVARSAATPAETASLKAMVNDEETVKLLTGLVREDWFDPAQQGTASNALDLLADAGNPAAFDVFVEIPQDVSRSGLLAPPGSAPGARPGPQVSAATMSWLMNHRSNPRVRRILDDIARGNVDPNLGAIVEQMQRMEQMQRIPQRQR